jgi:hypothetical protein
MSTHPRAQMVVFAPASKRITAKLTALIRVDDEVIFELSALYCHPLGYQV